MNSAANTTYKPYFEESKSQPIPEQKKDQPRQPKPKNRAYLEVNCLSYFLFLWITVLAKKNLKQPIEQDSHLDLRERDSSDYQFRLLKKNWERYKGSSNRLYKTLFRTYRTKLIIALLLNVILAASLLLTPIIVDVMIRFIELPRPTFWQNMAVLVGIVSVRLLLTLLEENVWFFYQKLGLNASSGLSVLIFDKCLRFSPLCNKQHSVGSIQNHFEIDRVKLSACMNTTPALITLPIGLGVGIYILYNLIGASLLAGFGGMVIVAVLGVCLGAWYTKCENKFLGKKDQRIKKLNELLTSIRYIKMSGFEDKSVEKVTRARREEIQLLKKKFTIMQVLLFINWYAPLVILLAVFSMFLLLGNELTPEKMFITMSMIYTLSFPLRDASSAITDLLDAHVSIKRIERFLNAEEIDLSFLEFKQKDESSCNAIEVSNGTFYWLGQEADLVEKKNRVEDKFREEEKGGQEKGFCRSQDKKPSFKSREPLQQFKKIELSENKAHQKDSIPTEILDNDEEAAVAKFEESKTAIKYALKNINLNIQKRKLTAIVGPTGCGKSSLFYSWAGEMKFDLQNPPVVKIYGHMSLLPQKPWLINATLKQNILFDSPFDENKYRQVIKMACLDQDIAALDNGDDTEIGERGINLSGGQKARVALARALYTESDIYLFDDTLSALDIHVGTYILRECILDYLRDKTRLLVTHNVNYLKFCDHIIVMKEGAVEWQGSYEELLANNHILKLLKNKEDRLCSINCSLEESPPERIKIRGGSLEEETEKRESSTNEITAPKKVTSAIAIDSNLNSPKNLLIASKTANTWNTISTYPTSRDATTGNKGAGLVVLEERVTGKVSWRIYKLFIKYFGHFSFWIIYLMIFLFYVASINASPIYLTFWANRYSADTKFHYLKIFIFINLGLGVVMLIKMFYVLFRSLRISRKVHAGMLRSVIRAPIPTFFDRVPIGRIINRFSKDIEDVDSELVVNFDYFMELFGAFLSDIIICAWGSSPYIIIAAVLFILACRYYHKLYRAFYRELERLALIAKSPIVAHFSESLRGLAVIRSLKVEKQCFKKLEFQVNEELKNLVVMTGLKRWFTQKCAISSTLIIIPVFVALIFFKEKLGITPAIAGLLAMYSLTLEVDVRWMLRGSVDFEKTLVSLERCSSYCSLEPEKSKIINTEANKSAGRWLTQGKIKIQNLSIKYREELPLVLKSVNIEIKPGEKIGIVGRTGSGKSTLLSSLLRVIEVNSGSILIDDVDIASLHLKELRQSITFIPQEATLFDGTIRENMELLHRYPDHEIWGALESIGLKKTFEDRNGLDSKVEDGGDNFSAGEKQLISIARGLLMKNKLVLVDEASSNIDMKTEKFFLRSIKEKFHDCTVLMIAHRLNTIIDFEKMLVLQDGEVVEFGPTEELLRNDQSMFYNMVTEDRRSSREHQ